MKKISTLIMIAFVSLTFSSSHVSAQTNDASSASASVLVSIPVVKSESDIKIAELQLRLTELNSIDRSEMTSLEKKELRQEERSVRREIQENNGGIYISGGALIIIIVLIIIFH